MLIIIKNNWERMLQRKLQFLVSMLLTLGAIVFAVIMSHQGQIKGNLAVIKADGERLQVPHYKVTYLNEVPPESTLVKGQYEAIIVFKSEGNYEMDSIKSQKEQVTLKRLIENPVAAQEEEEKPRQIGTTILGYMMMFLLMQAILYARLFAEDQDKHLSERILSSPLSTFNYWVGHSIFTGVCVGIPAFCMIVVLKCLGIEVGFSILQYMLLIGMIVFLATSVVVVLYSFIKGADQANMMGSALVILTSLLTGCFSSDASLEQGISKILYLVPQKSILLFAQGVESNCFNNQIILSAVYVILLSVTLMIISIMKINKDYRPKRGFR